MAEVQFAAHPLARSWISHPGELKVWGGGRPSYWMANGIVPRVTQTTNICALVYDLTRHGNTIFFTHVFVPVELLDEWVVTKNWIFMRSGSGYAAVWCSAGLTAQTSGLYAGSEWRGCGQRMSWLLVAGSEATDGTFEAFRRQAQAIDPQFDPTTNAVHYTASSRRLSTEFDRGLLIDGQVVDFSPISIEPHVGFDGHDLTLWSVA